jgi:3-oxoacyl-[acyl-carrier protein] reductase
MYTIDLEGKKVLLTGCDGGLGQAMLKRLTEANATVILTDIMKPEKSIAYLQEMKQEVFWYQCDLTRAEDVNSMFKQIAKEVGSIDILINNAGMRKDALLVQMTEEQWDTVIRINLTGVFFCTKSAVKLMLRKKVRNGKIISISSIAGIFGNVGQTNYAATKAGLIAMTKTWTKEYSHRGLTFNVVAPGLIESPMIQGLPETEVQRFKDAVPLGILGTPTDVANVVLFLCSPLSDYVNGQVLQVDGGAVI